MSNNIEMDFASYCMLKMGFAFKCIDAGVTNKNDIQSVLFPYFLEDRKKYQKSIDEMNEIFIEMTKKIIKNVKRRKTTSRRIKR